MLRTIGLWISLGLAAGLAACSSSQTGEGKGDDAIPVSDAGTDAVPQASAESVPTDHGAPPAGSDTALDTPPPTASAEPSVTPAKDTAAKDTAGADAPPPSPDVAVAQEKTSSASSSSSLSASESPSSSGSTTHSVRRGETLMKIAFRVYGDLFRWKDIYEANKDKIKDPNVLPENIELTLPQGADNVHIARHGQRYLIKSGDTLGTISQDVYGTPKKWRRIWKNNAELIKDPNRIFVGFSVYYTMTQKDRAELESFKGQAPLAQAPTQNETGGTPPITTGRMPASVPQATPPAAAANPAVPPK